MIYIFIIKKVVINNLKNPLIIIKRHVPYNPDVVVYYHDLSCFLYKKLKANHTQRLNDYMCVCVTRTQNGSKMITDGFTKPEYFVNAFTHGRNKTPVDGEIQALFNTLRCYYGG